MTKTEFMLLGHLRKQQRAFRF